MILELLQAGAQVVREAAQAVTAIPQHGEPSTEIVPYLTTAALIVYLQKYLKTFQFYDWIVKQIPGADKWAHRSVALFWAIWTALGLHFVYEGTADTGWEFHLITPAVSTMLHTTGDAIKVFVLQQVIYDGTQKNRNP